MNFSKNYFSTTFASDIHKLTFMDELGLLNYSNITFVSEKLFHLFI